MAKPNVKILGWTSDEKLKSHTEYKGFIFPALEDFGIIPVEAQSCGTPVIAFGKGGVLDLQLIIQKKCNWNFFYNQNIKSLSKGITNLKKTITNLNRFTVEYAKTSLKIYSLKI